MVRGRTRFPALLAAALFSVISPAASAQPAALDRTLVASWPLDGDGRDATGRGSDGEVRGAQPAFDRFGRRAHALAFDGSSDHVAAVVGRQPPRFTVAAWILAGSVDATQAVVSKLRDDPGRVKRDFELRLEPGGRVALQLPGPAGRSVLVSSRAVRPGDWTHVAATFDGTRALLYVDGAPEPGSLTARHTWSEGPVLIGARPGASPGRPAHFFDGALDDVQLFDRALSRSEVAALHADAPAVPRGSMADAPSPADDDQDAARREETFDLARLDGMLARFDAACARRDRERLRRVEDELLDDLRREVRDGAGERRRLGDLRAIGQELSALRGRVDASSLDRKRELLVGLTEGAWRELLQEIAEPEREGWSRR
jgi:hypothetical protein